MNRKSLLISLFVISFLVISSFFIWKKWASPTKIALVNFPTFQASNIALSNSDDFVQYQSISVDEIDKLSEYDFILTWAMGIQITQEQREKIIKISEKIPTHFFAVTSPENHISSLDSLQLENVSQYLESGNRKNYQSLGRYIRQSINGKKLFVTAPQPPIENKKDVLFHIDEDVDFQDVISFENYLKEKGVWKENAPKLAIVSGLHSPFSGDKTFLDDIIRSFEGANFNVYPITSFEKRLDFVKEIAPDAVIYFPHGRMMMSKGEAVVSYLKEKNIPMFVPISVLQLEEKWLKDKMGMFGGFMGQTIVMPELDGAIYPYVIIAQEKNSNGIYNFKALPDRLAKFTQIVQNFVQLKNIPNSEKKIAIYYYKGEGSHSVTAQGLEGSASLYNLLKRLKSEGYRVDNLPSNVKDFDKLLDKSGSIIPYQAHGMFEKYIKEGNPALVEVSEYENWLKKSLSEENYQSAIHSNTAISEGYMSVSKDGKNYLAVTQIPFGNVVILPQPVVALGEDDFTIAHGVDAPPTHAYLGSYLWVQNAFKADALVHFGTHGSLEFTPEKQMALSSNDWADILVGTIPHFYYYTIANVGESMMAKRRSYATTISYLTPAFIETDMRKHFRKLQDYIRHYYKAPDNQKTEASLLVKKVALQMGIHRDLRLDSLANIPYSEDEILRIDNFAEEISSEKINGALYTTAQTYTPDELTSSVLAIAADPIAYSIAALDKRKNIITDNDLKSQSFFNQKYLQPTKELVYKVLAGKTISTEMIASIGGFSVQDLEKAQQIMAPPKRSKKDRVSYSKEEKDWARAILEIERTIKNIVHFKKSLLESPETELKVFLNSLNGGYVAPSSGGDPIANPRAIPTGRNMFAINAEMTPSEIAWDRGVALAQHTIDTYLRQHGEYPKKVAYTFWSSEFIETEGVSIAQAMYMLGVEPVRDGFGRITDIRLIPMNELKRPRIDIVIQTSGQFRDLAASRLFLLTKAVELAANDTENQFDNFVNKGSQDIERMLVEKGISPKEARDLSKQRIFGGINGNYGTGVKDMILSSDKWEEQEDIANVYLNNMGASYGVLKEWGQHHKMLFEASLQNTDILIHPRQNNTWGALSLDHVFEFMGGINTAIKKVTGKNPDAYMADYRNRNRMRMQELKEAIGVEARSTIFNPKFIQEVIKGGKSSAGRITELATNAFGWEATRGDVIDDDFWNQMHQLYVLDKANLGIDDFFERENPAAMQELTAVMIEAARKGFWNASQEQLQEITEKHISFVERFGIEPSGFSGSNKKLQDFIKSQISEEEKEIYQQKIQEISTASTSINEKEGKVLRKENSELENEKINLNNWWIGIITGSIFIGLMISLIRKRKK